MVPRHPFSLRYGQYISNVIEHMNELFVTFHNISSGGMYMFFTPERNDDPNVGNQRLQMLYNEWRQEHGDPEIFLGPIHVTSQDHWNQFNFPRICRLCDDLLMIPRMCDLMRDLIAFRDENENRGETRCSYIRQEDWDDAQRALMHFRRQAHDYFVSGQVEAHRRSCAAFCQHFHRFLIKCQNDMNLFVNRQMWILIWRSADLHRHYTNTYEYNRGHGMTGVLLDLFDAWRLLRCVHGYVETARNHGLASLCTLWTGCPDFVTLYTALHDLQHNAPQNQLNMDAVNAEILAEARTLFHFERYSTEIFSTLWENETLIIQNCIQQVLRSLPRNVLLASGNRNMPIHNEGVLMSPRDANLFNTTPVPAYPGQLLENHGLCLYYFSILE